MQFRLMNMADKNCVIRLNLALLNQYIHSMYYISSTYIQYIAYIITKIQHRSRAIELNSVAFQAQSQKYMPGLQKFELFITHFHELLFPNSELFPEYLNPSEIEHSERVLFCIDFMHQNSETCGELKTRSTCLTFKSLSCLPYFFTKRLF